jgi:hypothetical protein
MALWLLALFRLCHHEGQRCWKVWPNDNCFALRKRRDEGGSAPVKIATGFLYGFPIPFVGQTMDKQGAELAEHVLWHVTRSLRGDHRRKTVFATFLGD